MSNDLISRQEAIDLVESFYKCDKNVLNIMVFKLKQLPSAQPEITVDHALTEEEIKNIKQKMADSPLVFMPSAQPTIDAVEVVRCKDCKYRYKEDIAKDQMFCTLHRKTNDKSYFCADGKRKERTRIK